MATKKSAKPNRGAFVKGEKRPYQGRPKGAVNKVTREFKETVRLLLESNAENVGMWLTQVAAEDPGKALDLITRIAEYASPKLARTELSGPDGKDVVPREVTLSPALEAAFEQAKRARTS